jgi:hypothetical protein
MCSWCEPVYQWLWENIWQSVSQWATDLMRRCTRQRCRWSCLCCNKWFCWIVAILVLIVVFLLVVIATIVVTIVCGICYIVCLLLCLGGVVLTGGKSDFTACVDTRCSGNESSTEVEPHVDPERIPGGTVAGPR